MRVPGHREAWAELLVIGIIGILAMGVVHQVKPDYWVENLARERSFLASRQIRLHVDRFIGRIHEFDLLAGLLNRRHFQSPSQPISHRNRWLHTPGIAEIEAVIGNGALVKSGSQRRVQLKVGPASSVSLLGC